MTELSAITPWIQAIACITTLGLAAALAERAGLDALVAYGAGVAGLAGALVGGHLVVVLSDPGTLADDPSRLFAIWQTDKAALGAFAGAGIGGSIALRWSNRPVARYADVTVPAVVIGYAIYRLGCWVKGCEQGIATDMPWAVSYGASAAVHPIGLYHAVLALTIFAVLWRKPFGAGRGEQSVLALALYASVRFFLEMLRAEPTWALGLTLGQTSCLVAIAVAAAFGIRLWTRRQDTPVPADASSGVSRPSAAS